MISLFFKVKWYNLKEQIKVICRYYKNLRFCLCDISLGLVYFFINPYRISKNFLKKRKEKDIYQYGETPLTTLQEITKKCKILEIDRVMELGSGRGRCSFWLNHFIGCEVIGIEWIPLFVKVGRFISKIFRKKSVNFLHQNFLDIDLTNASVIYLYGTCMSKSDIRELIGKFNNLSKETKIITISYPLSDFAPEKFEVKKRFSVSFPWGKTVAYLQKKL